jgi:hypothetical protein
VAARPPEFKPETKNAALSGGWRTIGISGSTVNKSLEFQGISAA